MRNKIRTMFTQICIKRFLFSFPQRPQLYSSQLIRVVSIWNYFVVSVFYLKYFWNVTQIWAIFIFEYLLALFKPVHLFRCTWTCKFVIYITVIFVMKRLPIWNMFKHYWLRDSYRDWLRETKTLASLGSCAHRHQLLSAAYGSVLFYKMLSGSCRYCLFPWRMLHDLSIQTYHLFSSYKYCVKCMCVTLGARRLPGGSSTKC
jgi:hypothetical protein